MWCSSLSADLGAQAPLFVLGTAQFQRGYGAFGRGGPDRAGAEKFLRHAASVGFAALDTAPGYGDAEECIGASGVPLAVHTKIDPDAPPAESLARSLRLLRRERVETLYLHDPDVLRRDTRDVVDAAASLVGRGTERLGVSIYEPGDLAIAVEDGRIGAVQLPLNVLDRRIPVGELRRAGQQGIMTLARSVFLQGVLLADPVRIPKSLAPLVPYVGAAQAVARTAGLGYEAMCLAWARDLPGVAGVVVGAADVAELDTLADAWATPPLDPAVRSALDALPRPGARWCDPRRWPG